MPLADFSVPMGSQDYLTRSTFLGELERGQTEPGQYPGLMAPWSGITPQQMASMYQSPGMQQAMGQFGVHFNPSQVQQSPFFGNSMMNAHPMLGAALSGGLMGAAMTPIVEGAQGAGGGLSRAIQGGMMGPQGLRQFQTAQMMAPMRQIAAQLPLAEHQRREQLLQGLLQDMKARGAKDAELLRFKEEWDKQYLAPMQEQLTRQKGEALSQKGEYEGKLADIRQQLANQTGEFQQYRELNQGQLQQAWQLYKSINPLQEGDQNGFIQFMQQLGLAQHPGASQQGAFRSQANERSNVNSLRGLTTSEAYFNQNKPPQGSGFDQNTWDLTRKQALAEIRQQKQQLQGFQAGAAGMVAPMAGAQAGQGGGQLKPIPQGAMQDDAGNYFLNNKYIGSASEFQQP